MEREFDHDPASSPAPADEVAASEPPPTEREMRRERRLKPGTRGRYAEVITATPECPAPGYVIVFQHIRKTGGTSLKRVIANNYPAARHERLDYEGFAQASIRNWWTGWAASLDRKQKSDLIAVSSHTAGYLLPLLDWPIRAITLVRDPVDRILSRWFFTARERGERGQPEPEQARDSTAGLVEVMEDSIDYDQPGRAKSQWFNGQSRSLLEGQFDLSEFAATYGPGPDADLWRERLFTILSRHYLVGLQEDFEGTLRLFAGIFGWQNLQVPQAKFNPNRRRDVEFEPGDLELIRAANWLDVELYEHYAGTLARGSEGDEVVRHGYVVREREARGAKRLKRELDELRVAVAREAQATRLRLQAIEEMLQASEARAAAAEPAPASPDQPARAEAGTVKPLRKKEQRKGRKARPDAGAAQQPEASAPADALKPRRKQPRAEPKRSDGAKLERKVRREAEI